MKQINDCSSLLTINPFTWYYSKLEKYISSTKPYFNTVNEIDFYIKDFTYYPQNTASNITIKARNGYDFIDLTQTEILEIVVGTLGGVLVLVVFLSIIIPRFVVR